MEEKKGGSARRKYEAEFKTEVLKMVSNGQSEAYVSKALGIREKLIYRWKQKTAGKQKAVLGIEAASLSVENQQLKERLRQLETARDILKKALAIFSRQT
jgi:transposase